MDVIQLARQLGKAIQEDECFINLQLAQQQADADAPLQEILGKYGAQREALVAEAKASGMDSPKVQEMNAQLGRLYADILQSENMKSFMSAQEELTKLTGHITQIVEGSAAGQNPDAIEYQQVRRGGCGGGGCSGH